MNLQNKTSKWLALLLLFAITIIGLGLIKKIADNEYQRSIQNWQYRLSLMLDVRDERLNHWLSSQYNTLEKLARNQSLRLYLSQLSESNPSSQRDIQSAQRTYLQNLLIQTAKQHGFFETLPPRSIKASIPQIRHAGIAIIDSNGKLLVATPGMPVLDQLSVDIAKRVALKQRKEIRDVFLSKDQQQVMGFIVPAPALTNNIRASIIGIRTLDNSLYPQLTKKIFSTQTDETLLVRRHQGSVTYLNKTNPNHDDIFLQRPRDSETLAAAYALENPGRFAIRKNYQGKSVLFISRLNPDTNWLLLQTITETEALSNTKSTQQSLIVSFSLGLAALLFILIAAWRHGASLFAQKYAQALQEKSAVLTRQKTILQTVTNNIGDFILIIDSRDQVQFANLPLASQYQLNPDDLAGKSLTACFGPDTGNTLASHVHAARADKHIVVNVATLAFNRNERIYHCSFIPINESDTLAVLHDITELRNAQEKHNRLMKHLVQTLTHLIDGYVPDSENHSAKTTRLARSIAEEINLSSDEIETLELAACLSNIGKLFIPKEILEKTTPLTDDEREILQTTINQTSSMLMDLDFDGPVLETIAQKNEHIDGSGYPGGLEGEQILITARILAVANAFVAMQSPRAYRDALSIKDILDELYKGSGVLYDPRVIAALMHVAENKQDWL